MFRIKTISKHGAVFLSPFCFTEDQAEKKIKSLKRWLRHTIFEIVPVEKYPELTIWKEAHPIFDPMMSESMRMLKKFEDMWVKLSNAEYAKTQNIKEKQK